MSDPKFKVIKSMYWSKVHKKNVFKQMNTKKTGGDEEKARELLNKWKEESKAKDMEEYKKSLNTTSENEIFNVESDNVDPNKNIVDPNGNNEEQKESMDGKMLIPKIHYTKFILDIPDLKEDASSCVLFGSSKSGKTWQSMDIFKKYYGGNDIIAIVISPNIHSKTYAPLKDKKFIKLDRWDDQLVKDIHKIQKKTKNKYIFAFLIDDCILEKLSPQILQLFLVLRNSKINTVLNLQSITLLSRNSRNNGQNFIFRTFNNDEIIEDAMKFFLGSFEPFYGLPMDDKKRLYKEATKDYSFIYLNALDGIVSFHKATKI